MRVQMKIHVSGTHDGQAWPAAGEILECDDAEALDLIASGHAELPDNDDAAAPAETPEPKKAAAKAAASAQ